jgi:NADP-dependent 3-hydroxy acid dehydrogenase YdfG
VQSAEARSYVHGSDKWLEPEDVADLILYCATRRRGVNISEVTLVGA